MMSPVQFYLYYPASLVHWGKKIARNTGVAANLSYSEFLNYYRVFKDLGEINLNYSGLQKLHENFILLMVRGNNDPLGFCLFKVHRANLVEIDIIVIRDSFRKKGWGKKLYGRLEQGFEDGTVFYVENTTFAGYLFFKRCGFTKDVDLIKVVGKDNRTKTRERQRAACV